MRNQFGIVAICAALLVGGCVFDNDSDDKDTQYDVHDYMPTEIPGTLYSWHSETLNLIEFKTDTTSFTETITGPTSVDGKQVYSVITSGESLVKRFYIEDNSIWMRVDADIFDWLDESSLTDLFQPDYYKLFDFSASNGVTYNVFDVGSTIEDYYVNFLAKAKWAANETITTPSGTFTDCPDFLIDYSVTLTPIVTGQTVRYTWTEECWFGKNTGPVKRKIRTYMNYIPTETTTEEVTGVTRALD